MFDLFSSADAEFERLITDLSPCRRHHNAVVLRDRSSRRLEVDRALNECPTCHQPLRSPSPDQAYDASSSDAESYVDPDYFRMLRDRQNFFPIDHPPSSPIRRLVQPYHDDEESLPEEVRDAEFISSTPASQDGSRIHRTAFQPNYFQSFFVEEGVLGRGGKGVVLLVRHEIDGCALGHFACKRVPVGNDHSWLEKVLLEVELLAKLSHPNLVSYRHVWLEDVQLNRPGLAPPVACAFILQQYCNGGDLWKKVIGRIPGETTKEELKAQMRRRSRGQLERPTDLWDARSQLQPEDIYSYFRDITAGLAYLHDSNYIHRDLKPNNCLLHTERGQTTCLISDFGEVQAENAVRKSTGSTGTISYCAPEVLKQDSSGRYGNFTTKSDIFSLGMILYFMCFGRLPYQAANSINEELEDIDLLRAEISDWKGFEDERRERPELPGKLYTLLKQLLALNPNDRPSANEVLTALKNATILEGMFRGQVPPHGLAGHRFQDLDSPLSPETALPGKLSPNMPTFQPVHKTVLNLDHKKRASVQPVPQDDTISPPRDNPTSTTFQHSLQKSAPMNRARTTSPSPVQDSKFHSLSPPRRHTVQPTSGPVTPALLMAPPTSWLGALRLGWYRFTHRFNATTPPSFRFFLFIAKVTLLAQACWPSSFNTAVGSGLIMAAAADLSWVLEMWLTGLLFAMHLVLILVFQSRAQLCHAESAMWEGNSGFRMGGGDA